jgi:hypothetical protein
MKVESSFLYRFTRRRVLEFVPDESETNARRGRCCGCDLLSAGPHKLQADSGIRRRD